MHHRSSISLCKSLLSRYPFRSSSKPINLFPLKSVSTLSNQPILKPNKDHFFINQKSTTPSIHFKNAQNSRQYSADTDKVVDEINLKFAEAREEIEMALESKETVYFDEEAECARIAVKEVLDLFEGLLAKLPDKEKGVVQRSMGLKIEQLKAELAQLNE